MPPIYWLTGSQPFLPSTADSVVGSVSFHGSVKRAKYQDESTNVSIVSVSRSAGLPHCGQSTCFHVGWGSSGLPGRSKVTSSGSPMGSADRGAGTAPQPSQWMTGIGQPQ